MRGEVSPMSDKEQKEDKQEKDGGWEALGEKARVAQTSESDPREDRKEGNSSE